MPQTHGRQIADVAHAPDTWQDERIDSHTNLGLSSKAEPPSLISTLEAFSPRARAHLPASPRYEVPMDFSVGPGEMSQAITERNLKSKKDQQRRSTHHRYST